jgi:hypothetical protein
LPSIQFIREGDFSEVKGAPTLRVVGEVQPISASDRNNIHIIRENITPDSIIENFLRDSSVQEPLQYLHAQAHYPRRWMPIWHYVRQLSTSVDDLVEDLRSMTPSFPASRDAVVQRLRGTAKAAKLYTGSPAKLLASLRSGKISAPKSVEEFGAFANAVQGLPNDFKSAGELRPTAQVLEAGCSEQASARHLPRRGSHRRDTRSSTQGRVEERIGTFKHWQKAIVILLDGACASTSSC